MASCPGGRAGGFPGRQFRAIVSAGRGFPGFAIDDAGGARDLASERSTHEQDNAEKESQAESSYADLQRQGEWPSHHRQDGA